MTEGSEPTLGCSAALRPLVVRPSTQLVFRERGAVGGTRPGVAEAGENGPSPSRAGASGGANVSLEESSQLLSNQADDAACSQVRGRPGLRTLGAAHPGLPTRHRPHTGQQPAPHPPRRARGGSSRFRSSAAESVGRALARGVWRVQTHTGAAGGHRPAARSPAVCAGSVPSNGTVRRLASRISG